MSVEGRALGKSTLEEKRYGNTRIPGKDGNETEKDSLVVDVKLSSSESLYLEPIALIWHDGF